MRRSFQIAVLLVLLVLIAATAGFAQHELIFPLVVNTPTSVGASFEYWSSSASVFNPNDHAAAITFTMYDSSGNIIGFSASDTGAFQTALLPPTMPARTGWLKVTSSQPLIGREYLQFYRVTDKVQDLRSKIYLASAAVSTTHFIRPEAFGAVGISIVFPSAGTQGSARGKLIHRETDGSTVSEKELLIDPNGQLIAYLKDLLPASAQVPAFPTAPPQGSVEIVFDQPVAVTVLQFAASEPLEENVDALTAEIPNQ